MRWDGYDYDDEGIPAWGCLGLLAYLLVLILTFSWISDWAWRPDDSVTFEETDEHCTIYQVVHTDVFPGGPGLLSGYRTYPTEESALSRLNRAVQLQGGEWKILEYQVSPESRVIKVAGKEEP